MRVTPETDPTVRSRRAFLFGDGAGAQPRPQPRPQPRSRFQTAAVTEVAPVPATWKDPVARLLRRATMGLTADDLAAAKATGYSAWLNRQLRPSRVADDAVATAVAERYPLLAQATDQIALVTNGSTLAVQQLQQATVFRAAFSRRQLFERMVEFWSDHFNISVNKVGYLKVADDRDVIRKYALGRFGDLLRASAKSPAMLAYLDQTQSRSGRPNQNYARELMELHTLGVDGGYTQTDVAELSRVLTGWTIQGRGNFYFDPNGHDWGSKTVLGLTIPAGSVSLGQKGIEEGERILDLLVNHPSTARFLAAKMLRWLLTAEPTDSQVRTVAGVYRATGGDISAMVRAILNDAWVTASPAKFKRPFHYVVSAARVLGPTVTATDPLYNQINVIGQPLFVWETPDGYPDRTEYWAGNIVPRWSAAMTLANLRSAAVTVDVTPYLGGGAAGALDAIAQRVFGGEMSPNTRAALQTYLAAGAVNENRVRETLGLALAAADFQWY
jgi:uncharacterized protein (DUF1800 family)